MGEAAMPGWCLGKSLMNDKPSHQMDGASNDIPIKNLIFCKQNG
jgi:hypothetical protein